MKDEDLLSWLFAERNHHFQHPYDVGNKASMALFTNCFAIVVAVLLGDLTMADVFESPLFSAGILVLATGLVAAIWGLGEHALIHAQQRRRLEDAIEAMTQEGASATEVLDRFGYADLKGKTVPLFVAEPDRRGTIGFHDTKIALGLLLQVVAVVLLVLAIMGTTSP